jgi:hypothetical protein
MPDVLHVDGTDPVSPESTKYSLRKKCTDLHGFSRRMLAFAGIYCRFVLIASFGEGRKNGGFLRLAMVGATGIEPVTPTV